MGAHKEDGSYVITVQDNGVGFDVTKLVNQSSTHIGIRNVKERIEEQCGGTLTLKSMIDEGTLITIRIPEEQL